MKIYKMLPVLLLCAGIMIAGCGGEQKPAGDQKDTTKVVTMKTIDNLKAGIKGETTASAKYASYATKAREEKYPQIAALFDASSAAETVHKNNFIKSLTLLGAKSDTVIPEFTVKTTLENLTDAITGETNEYTTIYPGFVKDADADKADDASQSIQYALEVEKMHMDLYTAAKAALDAKKVNTLPVSYSVCPKCGLTYETKKLPESCGLCGTTKDKFTAYK
jgi:rubrerythrin